MAKLFFQLNVNVKLAKYILTVLGGPNMKV